MRVVCVSVLFSPRHPLPPASSLSRFRQLLPGRPAAGCLTAPAQPFSLTFSLIYPHRRMIISCPGPCLQDVGDPRSLPYACGHHPDARRAKGGASGRVFHSPDMGERPAIALPSHLDGCRTISMPRGPSCLARIANPNPLSDAADSAVDCSSTDQWHGCWASSDGPRWRKSISWLLVPRPQPEMRQVEAVVGRAVRSR